MTVADNQLYFGDNLHILREALVDETVDLIYLDPPFNSKRDYNLLFKSPKGPQSEAQITAFEDSWHWGEQAEREFDQHWNRRRGGRPDTVFPPATAHHRQIARRRPAGRAPRLHQERELQEGEARGEAAAEQAVVLASAVRLEVAVVCEKWAYSSKMPM